MEKESLVADQEYTTVYPISFIDIYIIDIYIDVCKVKCLRADHAHDEKAL